MSGSVINVLGDVLGYGLGLLADSAGEAAAEEAETAKAASEAAQAEQEAAAQYAANGDSAAAAASSEQAASSSEEADTASQAASTFSSAQATANAAGVSAAGLFSTASSAANQQSAASSIEAGATAAIAAAAVLALAPQLAAAGAAVASAFAFEEAAAAIVSFGVSAAAGFLAQEGIQSSLQGEIGNLGKLGGLIGNLLSFFGVGQKRSDPLVIDLTGNGLNLTALTGSPVYYDYSGNGFSVQTGWVGPGSGFLVIKGSNGAVQMLGNNDVSGISALEAAVGSMSGTITSNNPVFSQLMVWEDSNGNGQVDQGELYSLQELGIVSISLDPITSGEVINGNTVGVTFTYAMADGRTGAIGEVDFSTNPTQSSPDVTVPVPSSIKSLPQLNGYGTMYDLQSAMVLDSTLLSLVQSFVALPTSSSTSAVESAVQAILYEWAGVSNVNPSSDGGYVNAQQLGFLEAYLGETYEQPSHGNDIPSGFGGADVNIAWNNAFNGLMARLILQSPLSSIIPEFQYNSSIDAVLPIESYAVAIASMEQRLGALNQTNFSNWYLALQVVDASAIDLNLTPQEIYAVIANGASDATTQLVAALEAAIAGGQTISFDANGNFVISGTTLNDIMYAGPGISELIGNGGVAPNQNGGIYIGANTDTTNGDVFVYNVGDGAVQIDEAPSFGPDNYPSQATLSLGAGITTAQISVSNDAAGDMIIDIDGNGDVITIDNENLSGIPNYDGVSAVTFVDGTVLTPAQLNALADIGSPTNTMLYGSQGADTFNSEGFATYEEGFGGGDTFIFNPGYGALEINEVNQAALTDNVLTFGVGIDPSQVSIEAGPSGSVVLVVGTSGDQITLDKMLSGPQYGVDSVVFSNGVIWSAQDIVGGLPLAQGVSASSYFNIEEIGDNVSSSELPNLLYFGNVGRADILFQSDSAGDLTIATDGQVSDDIILLGDLYGNAQSRVTSGLFADGSTLSLAGDLTFTEAGSNSDTSLVGSGWGNNLFIAAPGGDSIIFGNGSEDNGNGVVNVVEFGTGDGAATVNPNNVPWGAGTVVLGAGITADNVVLETDNNPNGGDLTIALVQNGTLTGDSLTIEDQFNPGNVLGHVGVLQFADGAMISLYQNPNLVNTWLGASSTTLIGTDYGDNLFVAAPGGDSITFGNGSEDNGNGVVNVVDFGTGDGAATVNPNNVPWGAGTVVLGAGITADNVVLETDNNQSGGDLTIALVQNGTLTGDSLTIEDQFNPGNVLGHVGVLQFADGATISLYQNPNLVNTWLGASTPTMVGTDYGDNLFVAAPGGDSITFGNGSEDNGNGVINVVEFGTGDGAATVTSNGSSWDAGTVVLGAGITADDVALETDNNPNSGDLTIVLLQNGMLTSDSLTIDGQFNPGNLQARVGVLQFADDSTISLYQQPNLVNTWLGASTPTMIGTDYGDNLFVAAPGGDSITFGNGSEDNGNGVVNVVEFGTGDGAATVNPNNVAWGAGTVVLGAGITADNVVLETDNNQSGGDLTIALVQNGTLTNDSLTIEDQFNPSNVLGHVGVLQFADGATISLYQNPNLVNTWLGASTPTMVGTDYGDNLFVAAPGGDSITFGNGSEDNGNGVVNVVEFGTGDGAATVNPNNVPWGAGTVVLGAGITADNVVLETDNNPNGGDLTIALVQNGTLTGDSLTIEDQFNPGNVLGHVGVLQFADGATISLYQNPNLVNTWLGASSTTLIGTDYGDNLFVAAPGGDSITFGNGSEDNGNGVVNVVDFGLGDGAATINPNTAPWSQGTIMLGPGITADNVALETDNNQSGGDLKIALVQNGTLTGDSLTIEDQFNPGNVLGHVGVLQFADGATISLYQNPNLVNTWLGASTPTMVGTDYGDNLFVAAPGGDSITFSNGSEDNGNGVINVVEFGTGDGAATVTSNGSSWDAGTVVLGAGITADDVALETDNNPNSGDLTIVLLQNGMLTSDSLTIDGQFNPGNLQARVGVLQFADDSTISLYQQPNLVNTWLGASTPTMIGTDYGDNLFVAAPGGDSITFGNGSEDNGNGVVNVVEFGTGDGAATVNPNNVAWGAGTVVLGAGITADNVVLETDNNQSGGDLTIALVQNGTLTNDSLTIEDQFNPSNVLGHVGVLQFADGATISLYQNPNLVNTWLGASTPTMVGTDYGDNLFVAAPGGDSITFGNGSEDNGNGVVNVVEFGTGDGAATVNPNNVPWGAGTVVLGAGITADNVVLETDNNPNGGDLTIALVQNGTLTGDSLTIEDQFNPGNVLGHVGVLQFADGATISLYQNPNLVNTWLGASSTTLIGTDYGDNLFVAAPGGDSITFGNGSEDNGNGVVNVVDFGLGDGAATINPNTAPWSQGTIMLGPGITADNVALETDNNQPGDLTIALVENGTMTGDNLTIDGQFNPGNLLGKVGVLQFADGSTISLTQNSNLVNTWLGTSSTTQVGTDYGENVFDTNLGNNSIVLGTNADGGNGLNILNFSSNDENVTISNPNNESELEFGSGISFNQLWFTQNNNDLVINVIGTNDEVDLQNWFSAGQLSGIADSTGYEISSGVNQLIAAMASFEANNPSFNVETATQAPNDPQLIATRIAAWSYVGVHVS